MPKQRLFIYVIDRDFGFAPNPFHGICTLATCKPTLRESARIGDWIMGVGGSRLKAPGQCIFHMQVTKKVTFDQYWNEPEFKSKIPVRNGSKVMMLGDNIYRRDGTTWLQADSHHSNADGTPNTSNITTDTSADAVLVSTNFVYYGKSAPLVPCKLLTEIGYKNQRNYRVFNLDELGSEVVKWCINQSIKHLNMVLDDPFYFENSAARYSAKGNKITK